MKQTRFLWILMVVLLVPAMALSGCDKKKRVNRDDDDDDSSSGSKEKSEQVDKEKEKEKNFDDLTGEYILDQDGTLLMMGEEIPNNGVEYNLEGKVYLEKNNELLFKPTMVLSTYNQYVETTLTLTYHIEINGTWNYDKKQRLLNVETTSGNILDVDMSYDKYTDKLDKTIKEEGGIEKVKENLKNEMNQDNFKKVFQFKVTDLNEDGFFARDVHGKVLKAHFERLK